MEENGQQAKADYSAQDYDNPSTSDFQRDDDDRQRETPVGKLLSEVTPERVSWFWPGRFAYGKVSTVEGDPGNGKSALTIDMIAHASAGHTWPAGAACGPGGVVVCNVEDGPADTIVPRLHAAEGKASRVLDLSTVPLGKDS